MFLKNLKWLSSEGKNLYQRIFFSLSENVASHNVVSTTVNQTTGVNARWRQLWFIRPQLFETSLKLDAFVCRLAMFLNVVKRIKFETNLVFWICLIVACVRFPCFGNQCSVSRRRNPMLRFGVLPSVDVACEECCRCMQRCWFSQTLPTRQPCCMSTVLIPDQNCLTF